MKKKTVLIALITALGLPATAQAMTAKDIKRCNAMAATLAPKKAELEALQTKRDALAEKAETTGEIWEEAEIHRNISADLAAKADAAKSAHDASKGEFMKVEMALQSNLKQFNIDVAGYNKSCSAK